MRRVLLTLEYHGARFSGFQLQSGARSVQGELEVALAALTGRAHRLVGAGRTDAGVHATGQTAHVDSETPLDDRSLLRALNAVLPSDVAVVGARTVSPELHARFSAAKRRYRYRILNRPHRSPTREALTWHIRAPLALAAMAAAARSLEGRHDFAAFRRARGGAPDEDTTRTLERVAVESAGDEVQLVLEARSFLRGMVRAIAGTLVLVGWGRRGPHEVEELLRSGTRAEAGPTAPARGLCLELVAYPEALLDPAHPFG